MPLVIPRASPQATNRPPKPPFPAYKATWFLSQPQYTVLRFGNQVRLSESLILELKKAQPTRLYASGVREPFQSPIDAGARTDFWLFLTLQETTRRVEPPFRNRVSGRTKGPSFQAFQSLLWKALLPRAGATAQPTPYPLPIFLWPKPKTLRPDPFVRMRPAI